ncbi:MAG: DUF1549 and DUF1553 domain-containing protein, partial [Lacipirellulaceae bacterium]
PVPPTAGVPPRWRKNPIDRFIYARLAEEGLAPNPRADRPALLRRVTYDLTGLPPTTDEVNRFVADRSPDAYEIVVDELLASPRYGEQWGRHWLDVVRFGESTGYEVNSLVDNAWRFRDYVIASLNEDKPIDQLITEHLAGDAVGGGDPAIEQGLAFLVCGPHDGVGNQDAVKAKQIRADGIDEIIRATSEAFLGLTFGCARCHDHKFDPISQRDYYRLYATFAGVFPGDRPVAPRAQLAARDQQGAEIEARKMALVDERTRIAATPESGAARVAEIKSELAKLDERLAALPQYPVLPVGRFEQPAPEQTVFVGGDVSRLGEAVVPASPSTLDEVTKAYGLSGEAQEQTRRLMLARWMVANDNPLTPRVLANRLWRYHFVRGIVATPNDFGYMGDKPTHPELLDWLAAELRDSGWRLKGLHRLIVTSETYRQSSEARPEALARDAAAVHLWRFPPRRLAAEELRDSMLYVAGLLDERRGGPGFRLYDYSRDNVATYKPRDEVGPETYRRAIYHQNARSARVDLLTDFDLPDPVFSVGRRAQTTTPLQALTLMNHDFCHQMSDEAAKGLALETGAGDHALQVDAAFRRFFGRLPDGEERGAAEALVREHGLRALCRALFNSNELLYLH